MKDILDVCCGSKMFYFDKNDDRVLFCDKRKIKTTLCDGRDFTVDPDVVCDFTTLPFEDESYKMVVFDPPHIIRKTDAENGIMRTKYGCLSKGEWRTVLEQGFKECFRVLRDGGFLIFKWADTDIPLKEILKLTNERPIFGHRSGKKQTPIGCYSRKEKQVVNNQIALNIDCMKYMQSVEDNHFDLAVVDPPYGMGDHVFRNTRNRETTGGSWAAKYGTKIKKWDIAPSKEYFDELFRVSKNQIIWGGNYFGLPPTRCFLVWDKKMPEAFSMAMCEYAWTSFDQNAQIFYKATFCQPDRFHPTQKPVELYKWVFRKYFTGGKVLDTHLGSGSSRCAAYDMNIEFVGCEIDKDYFDKQNERFEEYTRQVRLDIF